MYQTMNRLAGVSDPFEVVRREFRRGFDGNDTVRRSSEQSYAPLSVCDEGRHIVVQMDVPGVHSDDLDVKFERGELHIRGRRNGPQHNAQRWYDERRYGDFERVVLLDELVDPQSIEAHLENGVLSIRVARMPEAEPRRIAVRSPVGTR